MKTIDEIDEIIMNEEDLIENKQIKQSIKTFKQKPEDMMYLTGLSTKSIVEKITKIGKEYYLTNKRNNVFFHNVNIREINKLHPLADSSIYEKNKYFISINPMKDVSFNDLKYLLHLAYSRYLRFELGKKYRTKEPPIKMDIVIEEKDEKIKFNHIHIIIKTPLHLWELLYFVGILYYYMRYEIFNIDFETVDIFDELGAFNYMYKTKIVDAEDEKGEGIKIKKVISKNQILMNETFI